MSTYIHIHLRLLRILSFLCASTVSILWEHFMCHLILKYACVLIQQVPADRLKHAASTVHRVEWHSKNPLEESQSFVLTAASSLTLRKSLCPPYSSSSSQFCSYHQSCIFLECPVQTTCFLPLEFPNSHWLQNVYQCLPFSSPQAHTETIAPSITAIFPHICKKLFFFLLDLVKV